jgi:NADH:ubiquinone oxidoreductase subunit 2 (subunit N)
MSLIGIPITGGFFAKFYVLKCRAEVESGWLGDHPGAE